jgi:hypothetical protein
MSDAMQIGTILGGTAVIFAILMSWVLVERYRRLYGPGSAFIANTTAFRNLKAKMQPVLIGRGDEILIPAGAGCYPQVLRDSARTDWEMQLAEWAHKGIQITYILTSPAAGTLSYWQGLIDKLAPQLRVFVLDRKLAEPEDDIEIQRIQTFHPVLILRNGRPLCMWIEHDHRDNSFVANNVEYVAPADMNEFQLASFNRYLRVLRRLTSANLPHVSELRRSTQSGAAVEKSSVNAAA